MTNVISAVLNATFRELKQTFLGSGRGGGGGRGAAKYKKYIYSRKAKLNEKNYARQLTLKNIHATT